VSKPSPPMPRSSAVGHKSGRRDSNPRPPAPKAGALPGCATPRAKDRLIADCRRLYAPAVHALPPQRGIASISLLSAGLVALIALTTALSVLVLRPTPKATFTVAPLQADVCPTGTHVPVCYKASVANTGTISATMRCDLTPGLGSQATFPSGVGAYLSANPIAPGQSLTMTVKVDAPDGVTISEPSLACSAA
jgi:hypothetical protein